MSSIAMLCSTNTIPNKYSMKVSTDDFAVLHQGW